MSSLFSNMQMRHFVPVLLFIIFLVINVGKTQPLEITDISSDMTGVTLQWTSTAERYIVAQSSNIMAGNFEFVGAVLLTNTVSLASTKPSVFYKIREVEVLNFSDPAFRNAISNALPTKFEPADLYYDVDLLGIDDLNLEGLGISNAVGLNAFADLTLLDCSSNALSSLDVSGMGALQELYCYDNQITNLNLTDCTNLYALICMFNPLHMLDMSGMECLRTLFCYGNGLTNLNLSGCTNVAELICSDNSLGTLDVSGLSRLSVLACNDNDMTSLNLSGCYALTNLFCQRNQLSSLDISTCTNLTLVQCITNNLVDVSSFVTNALHGGLGTGDVVYLIGNPLSLDAITNQIPVLENYGVTVNLHY
ncbi:MAG: hypothetical protein WCI03_08380 [bacterium]